MPGLLSSRQWKRPPGRPRYIDRIRKNYNETPPVDLSKKLSDVVIEERLYGRRRLRRDDDDDDTILLEIRR